MNEHSISSSVGTFARHSEIIVEEISGFVDTLKNISPGSVNSGSLTYEMNNLLKSEIGIDFHNAMSLGVGITPYRTRDMHGFISCLSKVLMKLRMIANEESGRVSEEYISKSVGVSVGSQLSLSDETLADTSRASRCHSKRNNRQHTHDTTEIMSIYFGHPVTQSKQKKIEVSPALKERGIELLRAVPSQVHTFVLPLIDSTLWATFISSLSAICLSLSENKPVSLNRAGFWIENRHLRALPIKLPDICIQVLNPGPSVHQWLIDNNFEEQEIRGGQYYLLINPSTTILSELLSDSCPVKVKEDNYVPYRYSNLSSLFVFTEMVNVLSYVLQALSAPLWAGEVDRRDLLPSSETSRKQATDVMDIEAPSASSTTKESIDGLRAHDITKIFPNPKALVAFPSKELMVDASILQGSVGYETISEISKVYEKIGFGAVTRYVAELSEDDPFGVPHFFTKFMKRSLGDSATEILDNVDRYRSAWGILKTTSSGHILSHIVKSIEIAIEANCGITALFDHEYYEGSLLSGLGFTISNRTETFIPLGPKDLAEQIELMASHQKAWTAIKDKLMEGNIDSGEIPDDIEDMSKLRILCLVSDLNEGDRNLVRENAKKLRFPIRKWSINMGNLRSMFDILCGSLEKLNATHPIGPEGLFSNDPLEIAMSCFNTGSCPSFRHPSGVPVDLRSLKAPSQPTEFKRKGGKGPQQVNNGGWIFSVRRVDYSEAVSDFRVMIKEGEARSMSSSAARNLGYFVITGGNFEKTFALLRECLTVINKTGLDRNPEENAEGAGRPKRTLTGDVPGGVSKRARKLML
jgi:hypothetical protein